MQKELINELRETESLLIISNESEQSLLQKKEKLNRLFYLFKDHVNKKIFEMGNFADALFFIKELKYDFLEVLKYSIIDKKKELLSGGFKNTDDESVKKNNFGAILQKESLSENH